MKKLFRLFKLPPPIAVFIGALGIILSTSAIGQNMSNGANNFYTSDKVTQQKVSFKNQYNMEEIGRAHV